MKNKKILIIISIIVVIIVVVTIITTKVKQNSRTKTSFENNIATSTVILEDIEFKNITKTYEGGITTIKADVYNNTKTSKDINVKIILKDEQGKEVKSMIQALENIEPERKKILQTGITGDYTTIKDIEFKVLTDKELEQYD